jgi:ribosomal protein S18 acetylase RimI-like enzyme
MLSAVPLLHDRSLLLPLLRPRLPETSSVFNNAFGVAGPACPRVWVDDPESPRAVVVRGRRMSLFAMDDGSARRVVSGLPRNLRMRFGATPERFVQVIRQSWRGPARGRRFWTNHCFLYTLDPKRLVIDRTHRVESVRTPDAPFIASYWPHGRSPAYVEERIRALPSAAIRRRGKLVAWALTHDDGSMGFLHVIAEWRGRGFARSLTTALSLRLLRLGLRPFLYIVKDNTPSIRLTESMGFERVGRFSWFGR